MRKNKGNFRGKITDDVKYFELPFDFQFDLNGACVFVQENDLLNLSLPRNNESIFLLTSRVRNPDLLIKNIEQKEGIRELIIFASRIDGCTFLDKCDYLITSRDYNKNKRFRVHAKIIIVNNFIILGSGNLNKTNAGIEQYLIINSECLKKQLRTELELILKN